MTVQTDYLPLKVIAKSSLEVTAAKLKVDELVERRAKLIEQCGEANGEGDQFTAKQYEIEAQKIADEREQLISDARAKVEERRQEAIGEIDSFYLPSVEDAAKDSARGLEHLCENNLIRSIEELETIAERYPSMTAWRTLERYAAKMQKEQPGEPWGFYAGLREDLCRKYTEQIFNGLSAELERPAGLQWYTLANEPGRIAGAYGLGDVFDHYNSQK